MHYIPRSVKYIRAWSAAPAYTTSPLCISVRWSNCLKMEYRGWWMEKITVLPLLDNLDTFLDIFITQTAVDGDIKRSITPETPT